MEKKIQILTRVFERLLEKVIEKCNTILEEKGEELGFGEGSAMYGFGIWDEDLYSIKGVMASCFKVEEYLKAYYEKNYKGKHPKRRLLTVKKFTMKVINGKYLYDRSLEIGRGQTIKVTGFYCELYFRFLGYRNILEFLKEECSDFHPAKIKDQESLLKTSSSKKYLSNLSAVFVGYYYSYRDYVIKKFVLEIDYAQNKAEQLGFHYRGSGIEGIFDNEIYLDSSTLYKGKVTNAGQGLAITLSGQEGMKQNYMSIFLYKGGMNIQDMKLARGQVTTMSAHGYVFSGEAFFIRELDGISRGKLLAPAYDEGKDRKGDIDLIKKYLFLQRRTTYIPSDTEQDINKITTKKMPLRLIEPMVGTWKIWGLDKKNNIVQTKLVINNDYSSILYVYSAVGRENIEEQVCLLRVSKDRNGYNLWISAHEENGSQMKNVALVQIPENLKEKRVKGVSCNVGVKDSRFGLSRLVFIRIEMAEQKFQSKILKQGELEDSLFLTGDYINHQKAYKTLENEVKTSGDTKNFISFLALRKIHTNSRTNDSYGE